MSYHVVAFTMAQVRQGALEFQRQLGAIVREVKDLKVYSASPFDLDERRRLKDRFGGDVVYFFNDAARLHTAERKEAICPGVGRFADEFRHCVGACNASLRAAGRN